MVTVATALFLTSVAPRALQVPDTADYVILNHGRPAGAMRVVTAGDSVRGRTVHVRYGYQDRQRGPDVEARYQLGPDGAVRSLVLATADRVAGTPLRERERVIHDGRTVRWRSPADSGAVLGARGAYYLPTIDTPYHLALLARAALARPAGTAPLVPGGTARAEVLADTVLAAPNAVPRRLRLVNVRVGSTGDDDNAVWLDDRGTLVATSAGWFITVRRGDEALLPALRAAERAAGSRASAAAGARLAPPVAARAGVLVIRNGDVFDSERAVLLPRHTVVVRGDRISEVGPADSVRLPAGATVIDATGRTVLPGLWDMHTHLFAGTEAAYGALHLAAGVTTVRDLASDVDDAVSVRDRAAAGTLVHPRVLLAGFIDGAGRWEGPSEAVVGTEAEALRWVARYDSLGYRQIKLYNLVHPDLVPAVAAEAHRRGMRLSGHVPRGLSVPAAVQLGFDEINHLAFLVSTFYQDSLYVPRMRAYSSVAQAVAPGFDVDAPRVTELIALLKARGTVVDPTLNVYQGDVPLADGGHPVFGSTLGWLPVADRRGRAGGASADSAGRARTLAQRAAYGRLIKRLYDAGVPLVAGTDNTPGLALHGELEAYERAGIPAPAVLRLATLGAARVMRDDRDYGSVAAGKVADLVIVDGRPTERVADLRRAERVVRAGRVYRTRDLYAVAGVVPAWPRPAAPR